MINNNLLNLDCEFGFSTVNFFRHYKYKDILEVFKLSNRHRKTFQNENKPFKNYAKIAFICLLRDEVKKICRNGCFCLTLSRINYSSKYYK